MAIVVSLTAVIVWNNHRVASAAAEQTAEQLFQVVSAKIDERVNRLLSSVRAIVETASAIPSLSREPAYDGLAYPGLKSMARFLEARPYVFSVAAGYSSGAFIQVLLADGDGVRETFNAPEGAYFVVRAISNHRSGDRRQYLRYLDRDYRVVAATTTEVAAYDPRTRVWYRDALVVPHTVFSEPFMFAALQKPGITAARRVVGGGGVFTVSLTLANIADLLSEQPVSRNGVAFLFDANGKVLVRDSDSPNSKAAQSPLQATTGTDSIARNRVVEAIVRQALSSGTPALGRSKVDIAGTPYLVRIDEIGNDAGFRQFVAITAPLSDFTGHIARMQQSSIFSSVLALIVALPLIYLIARAISSRLAGLALEAGKIRRFELDSPVNTKSIFLEIHRLAHAFASMKHAVKLFTRYVPRDLVKDIVDAKVQGEPGGDRRLISVLFSDIADYTRISEEMDPQELMQRTSGYFDVLGTEISAHNGIVDKYIGDAVMAVWNAPREDENQVENACKAALACLAASRKLAHEWEGEGVKPFNSRFGLHYGEAIVGNIGGADRINYTAVGASINLASRLESLNKVYGTEILVSEDVVNQVPETFLWRRIDRVLPVGTNQPVGVFELVARSPGDAQQARLCELWQDATRLLDQREWDKAREAFMEILQEFPDDKAAAFHAERSAAYLADPPATDWDGVTRLKTK